MSMYALSISKETYNNVCSFYMKKYLKDLTSEHCFSVI